MTEQELVEYLKTEGYFNLRILPDGIVGCVRMLFTVGVCIDLDKFSHQGRVCYPSLEQAIASCNQLNSIYDEPMLGYTADKRSHHITNKKAPLAAPK